MVAVQAIDQIEDLLRRLGHPNRVDPSRGVGTGRGLADPRGAQFPDRRHRELNGRSAPCSSCVIHIADDNESVRKALGRGLRTAGYQVSLYESAGHLLENLPTAVRGCILLDVQMPGLNGPQLQEMLGKMGFELPINFLTGHGNIPNKRPCHQGGRRGFFV